MTTSYGALCTDFYVNLKLGMKMDLPTERQTVLDLFERVKKECPGMERFRRFRGELALESGEKDGKTQWLALRRNTVRAGCVNPAELDVAYRMHKAVLEITPFFLSISPLDVDYLEVLFGFDLEAQGNQNAIVHDALLGGTPLGELVDRDSASPIDVQPLLGGALNEAMDLQVYYEIKTRTTPRQIREKDYTDEPISVYVTLRKYSPCEAIKELPAAFDDLAGRAERLTERKVLPKLISPLREAIAASRF